MLLLVTASAPWLTSSAESAVKRLPVRLTRGRPFAELPSRLVVGRKLVKGWPWRCLESSTCDGFHPAAPNGCDLDGEFRLRRRPTPLGRDASGFLRLDRDC